MMLELFFISIGIGVTFGATSEPYICFDINPDLPFCTSEWIDGNTLEKNVPLNREINDISEESSVTIIYKLMGCIPPRLPLVMPICKTEDKIDRVVKIRKIFPYFIKNINRFNPSIIYPESGQWMRHIKNYFDRPLIIPGRKNYYLEEGSIVKDPVNELIKQRKKMLNENLKKKTKIQSLLNNSPLRDDFYDDNNEIISFLSLLSNNNNNKLIKRESYKTKGYKNWDEMDGSKSVKNNRRSRTHLQDDDDDDEEDDWGSEFPYKISVPFDPKKHSMLLHNYRKNSGNVDFDIPDDVNIKHDSIRKRLIEFPYSKSIPFDPKKHSILLHKHNQDLWNIINNKKMAKRLNNDIQD